MMITLEDFANIAPLREGRRVVRCGCGHDTCRGWAQVDADAPWGLRPWEAAPDVAGPLEEGLDGDRGEG